MVYLVPPVGSAWIVIPSKSIPCSHEGCAIRAPYLFCNLRLFAPKDYYHIIFISVKFPFCRMLIAIILRTGEMRSHMSLSPCLGILFTFVSDGLLSGGEIVAEVKVVCSLILA